MIILENFPKTKINYHLSIYLDTIFQFVYIINPASLHFHGLVCFQFIE